MTGVTRGTIARGSVRLHPSYLLWAVAVVALAAVAVWVAPLGLNLGDGGYLLAQVVRVLHGQVPHRDFITPRPAGAAYLHLIDFALPLPLDLASRLVTLVELVVSGVFAGAVVVGRSLWRLSWSQALLLAVVAFLGDAHTFPLIPFYTIDGLLFLGVGLYLLERWRDSGSGAALLFGALLVGVCVLLKQSFWPVPILALARLLSGRPRRSELASAVAAGALPGVAYTAAIVAAGGFHEMTTQLFSSTAVYGSRLWTVYARSTDITNLLADVFVIVVLVVATRKTGRLPKQFDGMAQVFISAAGTAVTLLIALSGKLGFDTLWSFNLFWCAAAVVTVDALVYRRIDYGGIVACAAGWMVTLSWGAPRPALAGGLLAVYLLNQFWPRLSLRTSLATGFPIAAAAVSAVAAAIVFGLGRADTVYGGVATNLQTHPLGGISSNLRGVRADQGTYTYLRSIKRCLATHPAGHLAIVPNGVLASVIFNRPNPFPIDLFWYQDYQSSRARILNSVTQLNHQHDYLILFETQASNDLLGDQTTAAHTDDATRPVAILNDEPLTGALDATLTGQPIRCWPFVGRWSPRTS